MNINEIVGRLKAGGLDASSTNRSAAVYVTEARSGRAEPGWFGFRIICNSEATERRVRSILSRWYDIDASGNVWRLKSKNRVPLMAIKRGGVPPTPPTIDETWLYFTMPDGGTVTLTKNGSPNAVTLEYSLDNGSMWNEWLENGNVRSLTLTPGQTMHIRNTSATSTGFSTSSSKYYQFSFNAETHAGGNIMSLICINSSVATISERCFCNLFRNCGFLMTAADMSGVTSIGNYGCDSMYYGCTSLTTAADMSGVTSIGNYGCRYMYSGCTSLTTAADMSGVASIGSNGCQYMYSGCTSLTTAADMSGVTSIGSNSCTSMYYNCTSLTTAADMSGVTSIGSNGCESMYYGCTSLTTAADMSGVTSIGSNGCASMYYNCNNLNYVRIGNPDISATGCLSNWLAYVSPTGEFYCSPSLTIPTGASGIPSGWTRHDI